MNWTSFVHGSVFYGFIAKIITPVSGDLMIWCLMIVFALAQFSNCSAISKDFPKTDLRARILEQTISYVLGFMFG